MSANIIDIKIGKNVIKSKKDSELTEAIEKFVGLKKNIDAYNEMLKNEKEIITQKAKAILDDQDEASVTLIAGEDSVKVTFGWDISVSDEALLTELLGDRFDDLVTTKISYTPTSKLKDMSLQDDGLKKCLTIKEKAPAVTIAK